MSITSLKGLCLAPRLSREEYNLKDTKVGLTDDMEEMRMAFRQERLIPAGPNRPNPANFHAKKRHSKKIQYL